MSYKVGDRVEWMSQANGNFKAKVGSIVKIILANEPIPDAIKEVRQVTDRVEWGGGVTRKHTCYIVRVDPGENKKDILYVPRVSQLQKVESSSDNVIEFRVNQ